MGKKDKGIRNAAKAELKDLIKTVSEDIVIGGVHFRVKARALNARFDDPIYESNREAWEHVTRGGCTVFEVLPASGPIASSSPSADSGSDVGEGEEDGGLVKVAQMAGLRKFGYLESAKHYGYFPQLSSVVCLEKENGENAQIGAFTLHGVKYWLVGSKNVPLVVRHNYFLEDLSQAVYQKERFGFARKIADLFWRVVLRPRLYTPIGGEEDDEGKGNAMSSTVTSARSILDFHEVLSSCGWTAVAEAIFLDSQHIVEYDKDQLKFFALAQPGKPSNEGLTALSPVEALAFFKSYGLETAKILGSAPVYADPSKGVAASVDGPPPNTTGTTNEGEGQGEEDEEEGGGGGKGVDASGEKKAAAATHTAANPLPKHYSQQYVDLCKTIGELDNSEGAVAYGLAEDGSRVVFVYKVKSYGYIISRRARQLILGRLPDAVIASRLADLTKIGVPDALVKKQTPYHLAFAQWLRNQPFFDRAFEKKTAGAGGGAGAGDAALPSGSAGKGAWGLQQQWVTLNKAFQEAVKGRAAVTTGASGDTGSAAASTASSATATATTLSSSKSPSAKIVIMLQGLPLTGKSSLARQLLVLLRRAGHKPVWVNQDEVAEGKGSKGGSKRAGFLRLLQAAMSPDSAYDVVIIDKSNVARANVEDYYSLGIVPSVTIRMRHPGDKPGSLTKLVALCKERFYERGSGHRTLKAKSATTAGLPDAAPAASFASESAAPAAAPQESGKKAKTTEAKPSAATGVNSSRFAALLSLDDSDSDESSSLSSLSDSDKEKEEDFVGFGSGPESDDDDDEAIDAGWKAVASRMAEPKKHKQQDTNNNKGKQKPAKGSGKKGESDEEEADIDAILGFFAKSDGAAVVCGGMSGGVRDEDDDMGSGIVINHSVLLSPEESAVSIWSILASNGLVSEALTPIRSHAKELEEAVSLAQQYESYLGRYHPPPASRTTYFGIALDAEARSQLLSLVPTEDVKLVTPDRLAEEGQLKPLSAVHHTLAYTGGFPDHEAELKFGKAIFEGSTAREVKVVGLAWDSRCLCAVVDRATSESSNRYPHVTMALGLGTAPVYSNELLKRFFDGHEPTADLMASRRSNNGVNFLPVEPAVVLKGKLARDPQ